MIMGGTRVMVVDSDPDVRELVSELLTMLGASVRTACSGSEAIRLFARESPDVVVAELRMADSDGYALIEWIRDLPPEEGGLTPAIAISVPSDVDSALRAGFHAFMSKPLDPDQLVSEIDDFVRTDDKGRRAGRWTVRLTEPGVVTISLAGHLRAGDMHKMMRALLQSLGSGPCHVVADATRLTGFSPAVPSIGERRVWQMRKQVRSVCVIGATYIGRLVSAASCKILGIPCTFAESLEAAAVHGSVATAEPGARGVAARVG